MRKSTILTILTVAAHASIVIARGKGAAALGLIAVWYLIDFFTSSGHIVTSFMIPAMIGLAGELLLLTSLFRIRFSHVLLALGVALLIISYISLVAVVFTDKKTVYITLLSGLPFMALTAWLTVLVLRKKEVASSATS
jgi:hypothetical protein